jgi:preprotein translocase SecE subunit
VARNRKRAKERRARRPQPAVARTRRERDERDEREAPDPIEHAAPDVELAEAQLAVGRPELADEPEEQEEQVELEELESEGVGQPGLAAVGASPPRIEAGDADGVVVGDTTVPDTRPAGGNRLINFLQGSWRELQRVQWPDRRQVMQATGVVIGFVIIAGAYLGVADEVASRIVDFVLK